MIPLRFIIKNKMNRCFKEDKFNADMKPSSHSCLSLNRKPLDFDFCRNQSKLINFVTNIRNERKKLLQELDDLVTFDMIQMEIWDGGNFDEMVNYGQILANSFENFDVSDRHDNNKILSLYTPSPCQLFIRRYNVGQSDAENNFISFCKALSNHHGQQIDGSNPTQSRGSSTDIQNEWKSIKTEKAKQFIPRPIDLSINDWLAQINGKSNRIRLSGLVQQIQDMKLDDFEGDMKDEVQKTENEIKSNIVNGLQKLANIQDEKHCLMSKRISRNLLNKKCFPEMAEIFEKANKENKQLEVVILSESEDEYESWIDSWSSD